jgi:predicted amidohydrolase
MQKKSVCDLDQFRTSVIDATRARLKATAEVENIGRVV